MKKTFGLLLLFLSIVLSANAQSLSEDEIVGKTTLEIKMWIDAEDRKKFVSELQTKGTVENFETKLGTKSGKRFYRSSIGKDFYISV